MGHILIVDDDKDIVTALEMVLTMEQFTVSSAHTGKESILKAEQRTPDLILLDYMLPDMTGGDVIKSIREDTSLKNIPIILISATHGLEKISSNLPIQGCIAKPFELTTFLHTISDVLQMTKNTSS